MIILINHLSLLFDWLNLCLYLGFRSSPLFRITLFPLLINILYFIIYYILSPYFEDVRDMIEHVGGNFKDVAFLKHAVAISLVAWIFGVWIYWWDLQGILVMERQSAFVKLHFHHFPKCIPERFR